jgi:hypothetical protein
VIRLHRPRSIPTGSRVRPEPAIIKYFGTDDTTAARQGPSAPEAFAGRTGTDELIGAAHIHDHRARLRPYELTSALRR